MEESTKEEEGFFDEEEKEKGEESKDQDSNEQETEEGKEEEPAKHEKESGEKEKETIEKEKEGGEEKELEKEKEEGKEAEEGAKEAEKEKEEGKEAEEGAKEAEKEKEEGKEEGKEAEEKEKEEGKEDGEEAEERAKELEKEKEVGKEAEEEEKETEKEKEVEKEAEEEEKEAEKQKTRMLEESNIIKCTFDSPTFGGKYTMEIEGDSNIEIEGDTSEIDLVHCITHDMALARANIHLSFRQVNFIDLLNHHFKFFGFTSVSQPEATIYFFIYLFKGGVKIPTEEKVTCTLETTESSGLSFFPVSYQCALPEDVEYDSIEILSSDEIAGLPEDETLLNPNKTQEAIEEGTLKVNVTNPDFPKMLSIGGEPEFNYLYIKEGFLTFTINDIVPNLKLGQKFLIPLNYPGGIFLEGSIMEIGEKSFIIKLCVLGKVEGQELYIEQMTILSPEGEELFILPSFHTGEITTDGYNKTEEEEDEEESSNEEKEGKEGQEEKEKEGQEGQEKEGQEKEGQEGKEKEGQEGAEGFEEKEKEGQEGQEDKEKEKEDQEGQEDKEKEKEGQEVQEGQEDKEKEGQEGKEKEDQEGKEGQEGAEDKEKEKEEKMDEELS